MSGWQGRGTPATALLTRQKVSHTLHSYEHDPRHDSYGLEVDGNLTVGIVPVVAQLDLTALAAAVGGKRAKMADVAAAERATGYVAGGITSPPLRD